MSCPAKHTVFQPTDEQWRCPDCGADNSHFVIEMGDQTAEESCEKLHQLDEVYCHTCDDGWSGKAVATKLMKKANRVPCPTCKGCGTIDGAKP